MTKKTQLEERKESFFVCGNQNLSLPVCVCIQTEMYYLLEDIEESRRFYSQIVGCKFCLVFN